MNTDYVIGGVAGVLLFLLAGMFFNMCFDHAVQTDCLNTGRTVVDGTVYACQKVGPVVKP